MVRINGIGFGWIIIDGKRYWHDVIILPSGGVKRRKGGFLMFGSHFFRLEEFREICSERVDVIVVGTGIMGAAKLSENSQRFLREQKVEVLTLPSREAAKRFNELVESGRKVGAIIHVAC